MFFELKKSLIVFEGHRRWSHGEALTVASPMLDIGDGTVSCHSDRLRLTYNDNQSLNKSSSNCFEKYRKIMIFAREIHSICWPITFFQSMVNYLLNKWNLVIESLGGQRNGDKIGQNLS